MVNESDNLSVRDTKDHDLLIKIDANLEGFMREFTKHVANDEKSFKNIEDRLKVIERGYYIAIGAIILLEFATKLLKI